MIAINGERTEESTSRTEKAVLAIEKRARKDQQKEVERLNFRSHTRSIHDLTSNFAKIAHGKTDAMHGLEEFCVDILVVVSDAVAAMPSAERKFSISAGNAKVQLEGIKRFEYLMNPDGAQEIVDRALRRLDEILKDKQ
jgi:hypothetical protein